VSRLLSSGLFCLVLLITFPALSHAQSAPSGVQEGQPKPTQTKDNDILLVTSVKFEELPEVEFPTVLRDRIDYNYLTGGLSFKGTMSAEEKRLLLELSEDMLYKEAIGALFKESQGKSVRTKEEMRDRILKGKPVHFAKDQ
jgi:hypothetical protein